MREKIKNSSSLLNVLMVAILCLATMCINTVAFSMEDENSISAEAVNQTAEEIISESDGNTLPELVETDNIDTEENTQNSEEIPVQVAVDTQEETVTTNKELEYHAYNLQIKNDKLVVCTSKNEVFLETGIWMEELPDNIIADIILRINIGQILLTNLDNLLLYQSPQSL